MKPRKPRPSVSCRPSSPASMVAPSSSWIETSKLGEDPRRYSLRSRCAPWGVPFPGGCDVPHEAFGQVGRVRQGRCQASWPVAEDWWIPVTTSLRSRTIAAAVAMEDHAASAPSRRTPAAISMSSSTGRATVSRLETAKTAVASTTPAPATIPAAAATRGITMWPSCAPAEVAVSPVRAVTLLVRARSAARPGSLEQGSNSTPSVWQPPQRACRVPRSSGQPQS